MEIPGIDLNEAINVFEILNIASCNAHSMNQCDGSYLRIFRADGPACALSHCVNSPEPNCGGLFKGKTAAFELKESFIGASSIIVSFSSFRQQIQPPFDFRSSNGTDEQVIAHATVDPIVNCKIDSRPHQLRQNVGIEQNQSSCSSSKGDGRGRDRSNSGISHPPTSAQIL